MVMQTTILTDAQQAFLDEVRYSVVGTLNADGSIQQTVVWFLREGVELRFSTGAASKKVRNLLRDPTVTLAVADGGRYLTISGSAVVEPADSELRLRLAVRYLGAARAAEWVTRRAGAPRASVRISPRRAYGQGV
jgi:PPOX class probable F420-dependent enzyme